MSSDGVFAALAVALFFAIHLGSRGLERLPRPALSLVMSLAGGVAVAYVFLHLIPDLARRGDAFVSPLPGIDIYLLSLIGLIGFFGMERLVVRSEEKSEALSGEKDVGPFLFWLHIGAFAFNSFIIGYLLVDEREGGLPYRALYAVALGLHFMTNDHALRLRHAALHRRHGRWVLAMAVILGWVAGFADIFHEQVVAGLFAILAGGITFNVLKEELPSAEGGSFKAFAAGALLYAGILAVISSIS